jgi:hypothetical protein
MYKSFLRFLITQTEGVWGSGPLETRIQEVPGPYLDQDTGYYEWGFSWFSVVSAGKYRDRPRYLD